MRAGETIRSYIWWTHKRGSIHYDVMVTLILLFIFLAPHWIDFNDKPTERTPHQTGVVVFPDGNGAGFIYQIDASAVNATDDQSIHQSLMEIIEPIAGEIEVVRYEPVKDNSGKIKSYKAWVRKPYR
ncbi:MAG: hypothetical protein ACE14M_00770 [Terriglobales bacterium]